MLDYNLMATELAQKLGVSRQTVIELVSPTLQKSEGFRVKKSTKEKIKIEDSSRKAGASERKV
jgi:biotin operon repressor